MTDASTFEIEGVSTSHQDRWQEIVAHQGPSAEFEMADRIMAIIDETYRRQVREQSGRADDEFR